MALTLSGTNGVVGAGFSINPVGAVAGIATFSAAKVGGGVTISESGIEASGIGITVANINGGQISGRRNIIINGAMNVAQRGTSSTSSGYYTVDRFRWINGGIDNSPTQAQVDVASGTTPYTLGFRKSYRVTNADQTSGAQGNSIIRLQTKIEAQDIANSGWNYTSTSSFITFSFWIKSSVAQEFFGYLYSQDGSSQSYIFSTGSLSADTWTKVIHTIPGNSNLTFDNNNDTGLNIQWQAFMGTTYTDNSATLNQWGAWNSSIRVPDMTSTWYTTDGATLEVTGVQLEVGSQATAFEHRSFGEEALLCKRYYQQIVGNSDLVMFGSGRASGTSTALVATQLAVPLRASPTIASLDYSAWGTGGSKEVSGGSPSVQSFDATHNQLNMSFGSLASQMTNARVATVACASGSTLKMDAEL